jgi:hypothetical protein
VGGIAVPALIGLVSGRSSVRVGLSPLIVNCLLVALVVRRAARASGRSPAEPDVTAGGERG